MTDNNNTQDKKLRYIIEFEQFVEKKKLKKKGKKKKKELTWEEEITKREREYSKTDAYKDPFGQIALNARRSTH